MRSLSTAALSREADLFMRGGGMRVAAIIARGGVSGGDTITETRAERIERRLRSIAQRLADVRSERNEITDAALTGGDNGESRNLTADEATTYVALRSERDDLNAEEIRLREDLSEITAEAEARTADEPLDQGDTETRRAAARAAAGSTTIEVRREPLTYERWNVRESYFADLVRSSGAFGFGDEEARGRLQRHGAEMRVELRKFETRNFGTRSNPVERYADGAADEAREHRTGRAQALEFEQRDLTRVDGAGGEFVPPLWMMEDFISLARGGRITADLCRGIPLPAGTDSINLPKVATGTSTAMQTADNAAVSETDATTTSVSGAVKTAAGQQDVALQLLEQSPLAFDQIIFEDLADDHAVLVNTQVINGSAAAGQVRGILQITAVDTTAYTDASPTLPELYPKVADSLNEVATNRLRPATALIMHTRRWFWMAAALDANNRPFIVPSAQGAQNVLAAFNAAEAEGPVGAMIGTTIFADPAIPTNLGGGTEDKIIATRPQELYLFEGAIRARVLPEVGSGTMTVRFQLYNYFAFIPHRRAEATSVIGGTGLAAPSF